jgi:hypothetical protein
MNARIVTKLLLVTALAALLSACGPSADAIATGIAQTLQISQLETAAAAGVAAASQTAAITETPTASETAQPSTTSTATATNTAQPSNTPTITATNTPAGPAPLNFGGHWFTNSGTLDIVQNDRLFTGTLYNAFTNITTAVSGEIAGSYLSATNSMTLDLGTGGLTITGFDPNGNELCGALAGHHFPMGCSFAGMWSVYREPTSSCDNSLLTITREDNSVNASYCNGRTIKGTITYPGNGSPDTIMDGQFLGADGSTFYPIRLRLTDYAGTLFVGNWQNGAWPFCGWQSPSSKPAVCKWP